MKLVFVFLIFLLFFSLPTMAENIIVNEDVKLGGLMISSKDYKVYYTGYKTGAFDNLYFEVVAGNIQYQMMVPRLLGVSKFELDIGLRLEIKTTNAYLSIKVKKIQ